jgi:hypothetical protein
VALLLVVALPLLLMQFVIVPLSELVHELGHGIAVGLAGRPAAVIVGRGPWATFSCDRLRVQASPLPPRGVTFAGVCAYDMTGLSWRAIMWIALAGPIASLLELLLTIRIGLALWGAVPMARYLVFVTTVSLGLSLIKNLDPRPRRPNARRASLGQRDGRRALEAWTCHRAGMPPPGRAVAPSAGGTPVAGLISVPPPAALRT